MTEQQMIIKAKADGIDPLEIPANDNARWYIMMLYDLGIVRALEGVFDFYASGIDFKAAYTNGRPYLEFIEKNLQSDRQLINSNEGNRLYYYEQISRIRYLLYDSENMRTEFKEEDLIIIHNDISEISDIQFASEENNHSVDIETVKKMFSIIDGLWDTLFYNHTYTYRYLTALCGICNIDDTEENRRSFIKILSETSLEW